MIAAYLWIKAFHIIAVICWFAGIFYLPRLFVYHASAEDQISRDRFVVMESKLLNIIMRPAMILSVALGIAMLYMSWQAFAGSIWMWLKIALVVALLGYHYYCTVIARRFATGETPHSERFFRLFNELPVLLLIGIVLLVVVKPF
ncbi:MAG: protoporphyrinogen oxidase HemJ [Pseudomonadota bacterium]